jgi:hypothetical protein
MRLRAISQHKRSLLLRGATTAVAALFATVLASAPASASQALAARPMSGSWTVSLGASNPNPWHTQTTRITATSSVAVPPGWSLEIYENSSVGGTPRQIASCATTPTSVVYTCSAPVSDPGFFGVDFVAYVAVGDPPTAILAQSSDLSMSWRSPGPVGLSASANTLPVGASSTLTATTAVDVGPTPFFTQIWDTTSSPASLLKTCSRGTTCALPTDPPVTVTQAAPVTHTYVATVAADPGGTTYPPSGLQSTSPVVYITWNNLGYRVSLSASATSPVVTATANIDVGPTPYDIYIYDENTGKVVGSCSQGTTCTVTQYGPDTNLVAFIGDYTSILVLGAPNNIVASSNTVTATYTTPAG